MQRIMISGNCFIDEDGCEVIFNGLCFICRDKNKGYLEPGLDQLFSIYAKRGFNLVRLGIFWDGVEPAPGIYDEGYLDRIALAIQAAENNGIYVFLDMHQDLFSAKFIDGAPDWATLDEGLEHPKNCAIWYEAYLTSPAVIRAADNFWANKPAADGVGLLDHYEAMWKHLAGRFGRHANLLGFEPMNEPFMGSLAPQTFGEAIARVRQLNPDFTMADAQTATPDERGLMLGIMTENFARFDRDTLMPFYNRILKAIRLKCDKPLVTGCNIYGTAVKTGLARVTDQNGRVDTQQIFAPHGYDSVVDTDDYSAYSKENVSRIFAQHHSSQIELQIPVIVGEWGNFPGGAFTNDLIEHMSGILERYLWSSTYHQYVQGMEHDANYSNLERGYPTAIAGHLLSYHYDYNLKTLSVIWQAKAGGETRIYYPDLTSIDRQAIIISKPADVLFERQADARGGYIKVITPDAGHYELIIRIIS